MKRHFHVHSGYRKTKQTETEELITGTRRQKQVRKEESDGTLSTRGREVRVGRRLFQRQVATRSTSGTRVQSPASKKKCTPPEKEELPVSSIKAGISNIEARAVKRESTGALQPWQTAQEQKNGDVNSVNSVEYRQDKPRGILTPSPGKKSKRIPESSESNLNVQTGINSPGARDGAVGEMHNPSPKQLALRIQQENANIAAVAPPASGCSLKTVEKILKSESTVLTSAGVLCGTQERLERGRPPAGELPLQPWTPVQRCIAEYAALKKQSIKEIWDEARQTALQVTLDRLINVLQTGLLDQSIFNETPPLHTTSGVSYVIPTESRQIGASDDMTPLPHIVIRPSGLLKELPKAQTQVNAALHFVQTAPVQAAIFPLREENKMKEYLLHPGSRLAVLEDQGGKIQHVTGAAAMLSFLQDRSFVCLHYCLKVIENKIEILPSYTVENSDVQVGIMVRKGVGGTYPLRSAARKECGNALSALLDDVPEAPPCRTSAQVIGKDGETTREGEGTNPERHLSSSSLSGDEDGATDETSSQGGDDCPDPVGPHGSQETLVPLPAQEKIKFSTLSCRLELYVCENTWKKLNGCAGCHPSAHANDDSTALLAGEQTNSHESQCVLFSVIRHLEEDLGQQLAKRSWSQLLRCCKDLQEKVGLEKISSPLANILRPLITSPWVQRPETIKVHIEVQKHCNTNGFDHEIVVNDGRMPTKHPPAEALVQPETEETVINGLPDGVVLLPVMLPGHLKPVLIPMREGRPGLHQALPTNPHRPRAKSPKPGHAHDAEIDIQSSTEVNMSSAVVLTAACLSAAGVGGAGTSIPMPWPYYLINTRDSFTHELVPIATKITTPTGKSLVKTEWYFRPNEAPADYEHVLLKNASLPAGTHTAAAPTTARERGVVEEIARRIEMDARNEASSNVHQTDQRFLLPVGITTYDEIFSHRELSRIETACDALDEAARQGKLPAECFHTTRSKGGGLKRTKFFFGARYLWTREQLAGPDARVALGVRADVPEPPKWIRVLVESQLVDSTILPEDFIDSVALNMYHDGSEGIQSHFDDSQRFCQPIYSLRLFSDSRLSFGTQLYGYTNGVFYIPMPRGCVTVMEAGGYAANGIKHCIRPVDMAGKSAGMILRRINPAAMEAAKRFFVEECINWIGCLSLDGSMRPVAPVSAFLHRGGSGAPFDSAINRPHRISAKIRKQVDRVMGCMLDGVEAALQQERRDVTAAALLLAGSVRKVAAAERVCVNLSTNIQDPVIFSVLDDIVSFCERPISLQPLKRKLQRPRRSREGHSVVVSSVMHRMLVGVELADRLEQQEVSRVMAGMLLTLEVNSSWQGEGPPPTPVTYDVLASFLRQPAEEILRVAQLVTASVLVGGEGMNSLVQEVQVGVLLTLLGLKVLGCGQSCVKGLRQTLFMAIGHVPKVRQHASSPPASPVVQFQVAVSIVHRALCVCCGSIFGSEIKH